MRRTRIGGQHTDSEFGSRLVVQILPSLHRLQPFRKTTHRREGITQGIFILTPLVDLRDDDVDGAYLLQNADQHLESLLVGTFLFAHLSIRGAGSRRTIARFNKRMTLFSSPTNDGGCFECGGTQSQSARRFETEGSAPTSSSGERVDLPSRRLSDGFTGWDAFSSYELQERRLS